MEVTTILDILDYNRSLLVQKKRIISKHVLSWAKRICNCSESKLKRPTILMELTPLWTNFLIPERDNINNSYTESICMRTIKHLFVRFSISIHKCINLLVFVSCIEHNNHCNMAYPYYVFYFVLYSYSGLIDHLLITMTQNPDGNRGFCHKKKSMHFHCLSCEL